MYALYTKSVWCVRILYGIIYIIVYEGGANLVPTVVAATRPPPHDYTGPFIGAVQSSGPAPGRGWGGQLDR